MTKNKKLLCTGVGGAIVTALCCFTPVLVVLLGAVGLSALVGWLDYGLFPALFTFMGVTAYTLYLRAGRVGPPPKFAIVAAVIALSALIIWLDFRFALPLALAAAAAVAGYGFYLHRRRCPDAACVRVPPDESGVKS